MPYGKIVDCWQRDNVMPPMPEEEYPIYQSASFRRFKNPKTAHMALFWSFGGYQKFAFSCF